jgi:adenosylhomocysteine nucleosidase
MRLGIIGAMDSEIELFLNSFEDYSTTEVAGMTFHSSFLKGQEVFLVKCGVGKVNAAICTQVLIDIFKVETVLFSGVAGSLNPSLKVGDILIAEDTIYHDLDATALGFELGQIPYTDFKNFIADKALIELACESCRKHNLNFTVGRILTGDLFSSNKDFAESLRGTFKGDGVDMESAAVYHTCTLNKKPCLVIRSISDNADNSAKFDFPSFVKLASKNSYTVLIDILQSLTNQNL